MNLTFRQLYAKAQELKIHGRSKLSKEKLKLAILMKGDYAKLYQVLKGKPGFRNSLNDFIFDNADRAYPGSACYALFGYRGVANHIVVDLNAKYYYQAMMKPESLEWIKFHLSKESPFSHIYEVTDMQHCIDNGLWIDGSKHSCSHIVTALTDIRMAWEMPKFPQNFVNLCEAGIPAKIAHVLSYWIQKTGNGWVVSPPTGGHMAFVDGMCFEDLVKFSKVGIHRRLDEPPMSMKAGFRVFDTIAKSDNYHGAEKRKGASLSEKLAVIKTERQRSGFSEIKVISTNSLKEFIEKEWK